MSHNLKKTTGCRETIGEKRHTPTNTTSQRTTATIFSLLSMDKSMGSHSGPRHKVPVSVKDRHAPVLLSTESLIKAAVHTVHRRKSALSFTCQTKTTSMTQPNKTCNGNKEWQMSLVSEVCSMSGRVQGRLSPNMIKGRYWIGELSAGWHHETAILVACYISWRDR